VKPLSTLFAFLFLLAPKAEAASFLSWIAGTTKKPASRAVPREQTASSQTARGRMGVGSTVCQIRSRGCGTAHIQVDVANNCMCVGTSCFKVASGYKMGDVGQTRYRRRGGKVVRSTVTKRDVVNAQTHNTGPGNRGLLGKVGGVFDRRTKNRCGSSRSPGCGYETLSKTPSTFKYDALTMSSKNTNSGGKWIHQIPGCGDYRFRTQGCIGVPCDKWHLVKSQMGKPMQICGGGAQGYSGPSLRGADRFSGGQTRLQRRVSAAQARQKASAKPSSDSKSNSKFLEDYSERSVR